LDSYTRLLRRRLDDFAPDLIVTSDRVPFLEHLFPEALVLFMEYSVFSRVPYPRTFYLDPYGLSIWNSFPRQHCNWIELQHPSQVEVSQLESFRERCHKVIKTTSPYQGLIETLKAQFSRLVLLPLSGQTLAFAFDAIRQVMLNTRPSTGVLLTHHADRVPDSRAGLAFLAQRFPNLILREEFENYYGPSQYLVAEVDALVTVHPTSVAFQSLLWEKKLLCLAPPQQYLADSTQLHLLEDLLDFEIPQRQMERKRNLLFWLLTRYAIPEQYLFSSDWLVDYMGRIVTHYRDYGGITHGFYPMIDSPEKIFECLTKSLSTSGPSTIPWTAYSYDRMRNHAVMRAENLEQLSQAFGRVSGGVKLLPGLMEAISKSPVSTDILLEAGRVAQGFGARTNAEHFFKRALEQSPGNKEAKVELKKMDERN
jgi:hypothetical protein